MALWELILKPPLLVKALDRLTMQTYPTFMCLVVPFLALLRVPTEETRGTSVRALGGRKTFTHVQALHEHQFRRSHSQLPI
jgi:hypothetical protein